MSETTRPTLSSFGVSEAPAPAKVLPRVLDMMPIRIDDVDIHHPELTRQEAIGLALAKDKVERYISKGWLKEAHGAASVTTIVYQALLGINDIDTGWGEL